MSNQFISGCPKGSEVTLYYNTGIPTVPVWVEHIGMVEDLDMNEVEELTELSSRRTGRIVKEYNEGEIELSISGTQIADPDYEGWVWLTAARTQGSPSDLLCLTNKITVLGAYGWRGNFWNSDRTLRGPQTGDQVNAVNLQPAAPCDTTFGPGNLDAIVRVVKIAVAGIADDFDPTIRI